MPTTVHLALSPFVPCHVSTLSSLQFGDADPALFQRVCGLGTNLRFQPVLGFLNGTSPRRSARISIMVSRTSQPKTKAMAIIAKPYLITARFI